MGFTFPLKLQHSRRSSDFGCVGLDVSENLLTVAPYSQPLPSYSTFPTQNYNYDDEYSQSEQFPPSSQTSENSNFQNNRKDSSSRSRSRSNTISPPDSPLLPGSPSRFPSSTAPTTTLSTRILSSLSLKRKKEPVNLNISSPTLIIGSPELNSPVTPSYSDYSQFNSPSHSFKGDVGRGSFPPLPATPVQEQQRSYQFI